MLPALDEVIDLVRKSHAPGEACLVAGYFGPTDTTLTPARSKPA